MKPELIVMLTHRFMNITCDSLQFSTLLRGKIARTDPEQIIPLEDDFEDF